jgi:PAS domain S-box-containing protein
MMNNIAMNPGTVLIVDDDPTSLQMLGIILKGAGYTVLATQDSSKVLPLVQAKHPEIVLLDITMPGIDGYRMCGMIHAEPGAEQVPVIFLTGRSEPRDIISGFEAGAVDYLIKPFNRIELLARLRNHLERIRYQRSLSEEKERFRLLTESVAEAYILLDEDFNHIKYANPAFERTFGLKPEAVQAFKPLLSQLVHPDDRTMLLEGLQHSLEQRVNFNREFRIERMDGTLRWVLARAIFFGLDTSSNTVCVIEDVTDRKVAERQLLETLENEAELAGAIQRTLLMNEEAIDAPDMDCVLFSEPSKKIDGDFYDVYSYDETFDVVVGDVMGKGIHAALVGAGAKTRFLRAHARLASCEASRRVPAPDAIVQDVDRSMAKRLIGLNSFFTVQYLRFARSHGYLEFVDCGHTPIIVWDGEACWAFKGVNLPIGFLENQEFVTQRIPLRPGNTVLVYSDGVTEATNPLGEAFGEQRLFDSVRAHVNQSSNGIVDSLRGDLHCFANGTNINDDVTLAAFRVLAEPAIGAARLSRSLQYSADLATLETVRLEVKQMLAVYTQDEVDQKNRDLTVLAASEAASNVIIHGLEKDVSRSYTVQLDAMDDWYCIRFRYAGSHFDWSRDRRPSVLAMDERGYGIFIMRNAMQSLVHTRSDTGLIEVIMTGPRR